METKSNPAPQSIPQDFIRARLEEGEDTKEDRPGGNLPRRLLLEDHQRLKVSVSDEELKDTDWPYLQSGRIILGNETPDILPRLPGNRAEAKRRKEAERRQIFDSITGSKSC